MYRGGTWLEECENYNHDADGDSDCQAVVLKNNCCNHSRHYRTGQDNAGARSDGTPGLFWFPSSLVPWFPGFHESPGSGLVPGETALAAAASRCGAAHQLVARGNQVLHVVQGGLILDQHAHPAVLADVLRPADVR